MTESIVVKRAIWGAKHIDVRPSLRLPLSCVVCGFTKSNFFKKRLPRLSPPPGASTLECVKAMQFLQKNDIRRHGDIRFNFVIAPDSNIYVGRGWAYKPDFPNKFSYLNKKCFYIGYMGDFTEEPPSTMLLDKLKELLEYGVKNDFLTEQFLEVHMRHPFTNDFLENLLTYK